MRLMSRGTRFGTVCITALLAGALGACSGDDDEGGAADDDGATDDGGGDDDAECGHCPQGAFELGEGGELRLELIRIPR